MIYLVHIYALLRAHIGLNRTGQGRGRGLSGIGLVRGSARFEGWLGSGLRPVRGLALFVIGVVRGSVIGVFRGSVIGGVRGAVIGVVRGSLIGVVRGSGLGAGLRLTAVRAG